MKNLAIFIVSIIFIMISCKKEEAIKDIIRDANFASELRNSPEIISFGNNSLFLNVFLNRDLSTFFSENWGSLYCLCQLIEYDSLEIQSNIVFIKNYVIDGDLIWISEFSETKTITPFIIEGNQLYGPKWEPYTIVDVVCEFKIGNTTKRIIAKSVEIGILG